MITPIKIIPIGFLSIGIFLLMQVILPIFSFKLWEIGQNYNNASLVSPSFSNGGKVLGISIENKDNFSSFVSNFKRETQPNYTQFSLSVPKLKIDHAQVMVDSNDATTALAHLPGTALPGERGNVFISGHSALSRVLNLQKAIFENLTEIKKGDEIFVMVLGVEYKYKVVEIKVVNPTDISVINPPDTQGRYISLMTCVPPGLNLKRLIVIGKMI